MSDTIQMTLYCNFCGAEGATTKTHDEMDICGNCARDPRLRFCEICGSTTAYYGQSRNDQKHYSKDCLKQPSTDG